MKLTIETKQTKTIEVPKYFKNNLASVFMLTGDGESYVKVYNQDYDTHLGVRPYILVESIKMLKHENIDHIEPISETEFKNAFLRVSLLMEELLNN